MGLCGLVSQCQNLRRLSDQITIKPKTMSTRPRDATAVKISRYFQCPPFFKFLNEGPFQRLRGVLSSCGVVFFVRRFVLFRGLRWCAAWASSILGAPFSLCTAWRGVPLAMFLSLASRGVSFVPSVVFIACAAFLFPQAFGGFHRTVASTVGGPTA